MGERKNIDQLFREKFKELDSNPNPLLWSKIELELDEKQTRRRRIVPFWWRMGGIAAAIALLFTLGYYFLNEDVDTQQLPITNTEENNTKIEDNKSQKIVVEPQNKLIDNKSVVQSDSVKNKTEAWKDQNTGIVEENEGQKVNTASSKNSINDQLVDNNENVPELSTEKKQRETINSEALITDKKEAVAVSKDVEENTSDKKERSNLAEDSNISNEKSILKNNKNDAVVQNEIYTDAVVKDSLSYDKLPVVNVNKEDTLVGNKKKKEEKTSIYDAIAAQENLKEKEEKERDRRWSINPSVAPVYYNTLGEGSPIHSQFADNSKSGNVNMSYGINIAYEINSRLSIRSGINRVNLGYDTDDISVASQAQQAAPIPTISYANTTANLRISDSPTAGDLLPINRSEINAEAPGIDGFLTQEFGYLEVPLEIKYKLIDKKIGIHLVGGLSSLFLTDNSITVSSNDLIINVGEANNINNISFSTNIGFGLDYKLTKKVLLNLEPIFKYQLNTFSNENSGFRPYTIGVYTGLSFRF
jgi:hypothetical protein